LASAPGLSEVEWESLYRRLEKPLFDEALPDKLRRVLLLTAFSELSYDAIVEMLPIPAGKVASRRHIAMMTGVHDRFEMQIQLNGSRLINQKAHGTGIRLVDAAYTAATLPSGNPDVRIYWIEKKPVEPGAE